MRCPYCATMEDRVIDSRLVRAGRVIRRRRHCEGCEKRFTTYEAIEEGSPVIVKKDGRREAYNREKLLSGIVAACQKRPIPRADIESAVDLLESRVFEGTSPEVEAEVLGQGVMDFLKRTDPIAYIRFASVYRSFTDLHEFLDEIQDFIEKSATDPNAAE